MSVSSLFHLQVVYNKCFEMRNDTFSWERLPSGPCKPGPDQEISKSVPHVELHPLLALIDPIIHHPSCSSHPLGLLDVAYNAVKILKPVLKPCAVVNSTRRQAHPIALK